VPLRARPWPRALLLISALQAAPALAMPGLPPLGRAPGVDPLRGDVISEVLENGLTVVIEEQRRTPEVAVQLHVRVGSRDEGPAERGCAHLFEHLMFEGSAHAPGRTYDEATTAAGMENNAWTTADETVYTALLSAEGLDLLLFLESDRLGRLSSVTPDALKNQQDVVLQERAEGYAAVFGREGDAMTRLLWPADHPYHHPVIGTVADIRGFSAKAALALHGRAYSPGNAVLVIVGDVDADEAMASARRWFSDVPAGAGRLARATAAETPWDPMRQDGMLEDMIDERSLSLAWPGPPADHPDAAALHVLAMALSNGRGTRLDDALLYDRRRASDAGAVFWDGDLGGELHLWATSERVRLPRLARALEDALRSFTTTPATAAELQRAKGALRAALVDQLSTPEGRAERIGACVARGHAPDCARAQLEAAQRVSAADLARVIDQWLGPAARRSLSVVPVGDKGALPGAIPVELP
jgi:zinc protease